MQRITMCFKRVFNTTEWGNPTYAVFRPITGNYYYWGWRAHITLGMVIDHSYFTTVTGKGQSHFTRWKDRIMDQSHFTVPR